MTRPSSTNHNDCLHLIYISRVHPQLHYANISRASSNPNKLKKLYNKQKHAAIIICNERNSHLKNLNILNINQQSKHFSNVKFSAENKTPANNIKIIFYSWSFE